MATVLLNIVTEILNFRHVGCPVKFSKDSNMQVKSDADI